MTVAETVTEMTADGKTVTVLRGVGHSTGTQENKSGEEEPVRDRQEAVLALRCGRVERFARQQRRFGHTAVTRFEHDLVVTHMGDRILDFGCARDRDRVRVGV